MPRTLICTTRSMAPKDLARARTVHLSSYSSTNSNCLNSKASINAWEWAKEPGQEKRKSANTVLWLPPPSILPTQCTAALRCSVALCAGLAPRIRPRIPPPPVQLLHPPIRVALDSQRRSRGRPGARTSARQALYWNTASQHALAHTTPNAHTVTCVGRSKGRVRARAAVHRAPAEGGHLDCLVWAREHGCKWDKEECENVATDPATLRWIKKQLK